MDDTHQGLAKLKAILVHFFTASGVVFGFLALLSAINNNFPACIFWLALALVVDGFDGTLARRYKVDVFTPNIDGAVLDNIIDFFTYVIVPVFMIYNFNFLSNTFALPVSFLILLVSCFTFINKDLKTDDYYFTGFPALWNMLVLYLYILESSQLTNLITILFLCIMTFVPMKFVHPLRVVHLRKTSMIMVLLWCITTVYILISGVENQIVFYTWVLVNLYFLYSTVHRTFFAKAS
jgi:phosphatidylcholine synthase|tara:strand:+ start:527 stop:1234 length:708 start_codon:yes stop_codon:yes gene_type:complete